MPSAGSVITGAAGGAASGFAIGGPIGAGIGGFVGLLGSLFGGGKSAEEIMAERKIAAQKAVAQAYALKRKNLSTDTKELVAQATQGASRRALAGGREATEGDVVGATGQVYAQGGKALRDLTEAEAEQMASIEAGYAARPIEEDMPLSDVLQSLGATAASFAMNDRLTKTLAAQKAAADKVAVNVVPPEATSIDQGGAGLVAERPAPTEPISAGYNRTQTPAVTDSAWSLDDAYANVNAALQASNPNAQGAIGAKQGWSNRMFNNSQSKVPGGYKNLMQQIGRVK